MTCNSKLALVTFLAGLLSLASVATVSANAPCTGYAQEHCEAMTAVNDATFFAAALAPTPVHLLSANGMGQEHFEAMTSETVSVFSVAPTAPRLPGYAQEHFEELMSK